MAVLLCAAFSLHAGGGFGGFGGGGRGGGGFGGGFGGGGAFGGANNQQYNNNGTVGTASISVDPNTHNLVIVADKDTYDQIMTVVHQLDVPQRQVQINVAFVEVDDSKALNLGVQGDYTGFTKNWSTITGYMTNYTYYPGSSPTTPGTIGPNGYNAQSSSYNLQNNFGVPQSLSGATGSGGLYTIMGNDFTATMQAIATSGKAQILSRPSILARDGQMAEIVVGQYVYLPSSVTLTSVGNSGTTVPSINGQYQNVGIQLDVTPFIQMNNLVQMILVPQITSIDTSTPGQVISGGTSGVLGVGAVAPVYAPNLNKRSANTVVITPNGEPVVIGGLIGNTKSTSESKIPLLGDIPVIGNLFKFTNRANQKNELLIFLTPHIMEAPADLAVLTAHDTAQAPLITNSIPEMELNRFLDRLPVKKN
ncbi:MAG TPA: secretin N-terminal domain-containing protein [Verrucomicrobiae bacterium]|nr:secretin N-terminal domain-containing protein [Verrucomicrobiae bacterium]